MKIKLKIQQKIQLFIISASIIIYIIAIGYVSFNARKMAYKDATEVTNRYVHEKANDIKAKLEADLALVKTLADAFHTYKYLPTEQWQDLFLKMYNEVFMSNPHIYSLWDSWELNAIDPDWDKPTGRYVIIFWREGSIIKHNVEYRSLDGDPVLYGEIKTKTTPSLWEPYEDVFAQDKAEKFLMTSMNAPIMENGKYIGIVAIDITLNRFQELVEEIKPFDGSHAYLVSNGGLIAGHPEKELLNSRIEDLYPEENIDYEITKNIFEGNPISYVSKDVNGVKNFVAYAPIFVGETNTPWSIAISVPIDTIMAKANRNFRLAILVGVLGILLMTLVIAIISRNITNPITRITKLLKQLAKGHLDEEMKINIKTGDEIEEMTEALNSSINGLNKKVDFANLIGQGKLSSNFDLLSEEDVLGKSLIDMRTSLIKADEEEEKRKIEDEKRRWGNEGLAKFADILRQNNDNIKNLATEIIVNLVNYLKANQGGLFILNDEDKDNICFDLLSAFAYDRKKFMKKKILIGEGLIGTCAIEKKTIFMTNVPQNYLEITSGLGGANPNSLLIVPLRMENDILGVIEIASFNEFEKHEIEFVEKLAESTASTLSSVRINIRTTELLDRSQQQAEKMAAQEEEMRQNMEEMVATQEDSTRKSEETKKLLEISQQQTEELAAQEEEMRQNMEEMQAIQEESNRKAIEREELLKEKQEQAEKMAAQEKMMHQNMKEMLAVQEESNRKTEETKKLLEISQQQAEEMAAQEEEMRQNMEEMQAIQEESNRKAKETEELLKQKQEQAEKMAAQEEMMRQNMEEMLAIQEESTRKTEETNRLLKISQQQTEELATQEEELRQNMEELHAVQEESTRKATEMECFVEALNSSSYVIEYDMDGKVQKINDNYLELLGITKKEAIGTHHSKNVKLTEKQKVGYARLWEKLKDDQIVKEITTITLNDKDFVFSETYTPIKNMEGKVYKVLKISNNITDFQKK